MKKTFLAFYDVLWVSIISAILFTVALSIMFLGQLGNLDWCVENWGLVLLFALCIALPATLIVGGIHRITIDLVCDKVDLFYLVNHKTNSKDLNSNWVIYPSEIEKITVVKLSNEEKHKYTSARFLFSKYFKIDMKFGHTKYVYLSHYSNYQITKIHKLLTSEKRIKT